MLKIKANTKWSISVLFKILWLNSFTQHGGICLFFINCITSNTIYINDIIDNEGNISENLIFNKLKNKHNWRAELHTMLKCLPKLWITVLECEISITNRVKTE